MDGEWNLIPFSVHFCVLPAKLLFRLFSPLWGMYFSAPANMPFHMADFSSTYCEETGRWREMDIDEEIATTTLVLPLMFPNFDLSGFEEMNRFLSEPDISIWEHIMKTIMF